MPEIISIDLDNLSPELQDLKDSYKNNLRALSPQQLNECIETHTGILTEARNTYRNAAVDSPEATAAQNKFTTSRMCLHCCIGEYNRREEPILKPTSRHNILPSPSRR